MITETHVIPTKSQKMTTKIYAVATERHTTIIERCKTTTRRQKSDHKTFVMPTKRHSHCRDAKHQQRDTSTEVHVKLTKSQRHAKQAHTET